MNIQNIKPETNPAPSTITSNNEGGFSMFQRKKPRNVKFPFTIDFDPGFGRGMLYPPHTHGLTELGMPEFLIDPLAFLPLINCDRINMAYVYFNKPEHTSQLNAILNGETVKVTSKDLDPEYLSDEKLTYCYRRVNREFEAVKQAYPHKMYPATRFILIWVDGDYWALTDNYYRTGIKC